MSLEKYLADLSELATKHKVKIELSPTKKVQSGRIKCSGFFDCPPKGIIKVAIGRPLQDWLEVLVHESCHMEQWAENTKVWRDYENPLNMTGYYDEWLSGKNVSKKSAVKAAKYIQNLELDCEKRSVDKIKKYKLPIDIIRYKRRANCYVYSYAYMIESRIWIPSVYDTPYINDFPSVWKSNYTKLPKSIKETFDKITLLS